RRGIAHLWDLNSRTVVRTFGPYWDYRAAAFSPDGTWLALGCWSGQILQFDLLQKDSRPLVHHPNAGPIISLVYTPYGSLAWCSHEGSIKIQEARSGKDRYVFRGHETWAYAVAVSPDGRRLASGGDDGTIRIHDATA